MWSIYFQMSDSEDDYMSDAFLSQLNDKRPGLIHGEKARKLIQQTRIKKLDEENRERNKLKSRKHVTLLMQEKREDSLQTHMTEQNPENKGLKLMMKMGFKMGTGLGKEGEGTVSNRLPRNLGLVK